VGGKRPPLPIEGSAKSPASTGGCSAWVLLVPGLEKRPATRRSSLAGPRADGCTEKVVRDARMICGVDE